MCQPITRIYFSGCDLIFVIKVIHRELPFDLPGAEMKLITLNIGRKTLKLYFFNEPVTNLCVSEYLKERLMSRMTRVVNQIQIQNITFCGWGGLLIGFI